MGWHADRHKLTTAGTWAEKEGNLHAYVLELKSIFPALHGLKECLLGHTASLMSKNVTM